MPEFDRWVQRCVRRINWGEFLSDAAEWLAGFCFVFGTTVLLVKLRIPQWWPHVGWLATAVIPVTAVAWWLSRRRQVPKHAAVALLDQRLEAGGLLMTLSETNGPAWRSKLPQLESLWQNALPRLWPSRFVRMLALPVVFAVASCFVPLRNIQEPVVEGAVTQQAIDRLNELTEKLTEAQIIQEDDPESEQLIDEMKKFATENSDKPLTHEKWETVDALEAKLKAKLEKSVSVMMQASEALSALTGALDELAKTGATPLSDEQLAQLENDVAKALQQLAKGGALEKLPPELRQQLAEMAKNGKFQLPQDAAAREALAKDLQEFLDQEGQKLADLRGQCQNGKCQGNGFDPEKHDKQDGQPGRGGVSEGRGDAEIRFGEKSDESGTKFKATVLPPGFLDQPNNQLLKITSAAPEVAPNESAPQGSARSQEATTGNETATQKVRPRHRSVVKQYFQSGKK